MYGIQFILNEKERKNVTSLLNRFQVKNGSRLLYNGWSDSQSLHLRNEVIGNRPFLVV